MKTGSIKKVLSVITVGITACVVSQAPLAQAARYFNPSTAKATAVMDASGEISSTISGNLTYITAGNQGVTNLLGLVGTNTLVFTASAGQDKIPTVTNIVLQVSVNYTNKFASLAKPLVVGPFTVYVKKFGPTQERLYISGKNLSYSTLNQGPFRSIRPAYTNGFFYGKAKGDTSTFIGTARVYKGTIVNVTNLIFTGTVGGFGTGSFTPLPNGAATYKVLKAAGPSM